MFDFGMGELGVIAVVGLLVLGPERLPRVARTVGALMRKARQSWHSVRDEIERELAAEDLKRQMMDLQQTAASIDPRAELAAAARSVQDAVAAASVPVPAPSMPAPTAAAAAETPAAPAPTHPDAGAESHERS